MAMTFLHWQSHFHFSCSEPLSLLLVIFFFYPYYLYRLVSRSWGGRHQRPVKPLPQSRFTFGILGFLLFELL